MIRPLTRHGPSRLAAIASALLLFCAASHAQLSAQGVLTAASQPSGTGLGVRAKLPPPIRGIGGVRSKAPSPMGASRRGSLLDRPSPILPPAPSGPSTGDRGQFQPDLGFGSIGGGRGPDGRGFGGDRRGPFDPRMRDPRPRFQSPNPSPDGVAVSTGNGLTVNGVYTGDKFRLGFHLGSGYPGYRPIYRPHYYRPYGYLNYWYDDYYYEPTPPSAVYGAPDWWVLYGQQMAAQPAPANQPAPAPMTPIEKADALLAAGKPAEAVKAYRDYLDSNPDDAVVMRLLAVALIDAKRLDQAIAVFAMAYQKNPQLARDPLDPDAVPGGDEQMRRRVVAASVYANRIKTGSAWLTLVVLTQAEGRNDVALRLLDRAKAAGVAENILAELSAALSNN